MNALISVFAVILVGHLIRRWRFVDDVFWAQLERIIYYLFFPCLLLGATAVAELKGMEPLRMGLVIFLATGVTGALIFASWPLCKRLGVSGPAFTSIMQGGVRPNTFIGLATVGALHGKPGLTLAAVAIMVEVPLVNLLSVLALTMFGTKSKPGLRPVLVELGKNPLLLSALSGFAINLSGIVLPGPLMDTMGLLGKSALPMGLLAVGAGLSLHGLRARSRPLGLALAIKLLLLPSLCLLGLRLLNVSGLAASVALLFTIIPCAPSSYILARQLGGDEQLMAAIITLGILVAAVSMPLWLAVTGL